MELRSGAGSDSDPHAGGVGRWFASAWPGRWRHLDLGEVPRPETPAGDVVLREEITARVAGVERPDGLAAADVVVRNACEDCGAVIIAASDPRPFRREWVGLRDGDAWRWRPIPPSDPDSPADPVVRLGGDHRHDDLTGPTDGRIRFYGQHPTGPYKSEAIGEWRDVVAAMPYFVALGDPFPPLPVVNEAMSTGWCRGGMSGGVEFPPTTLTMAEYERLRAWDWWDRIGYAEVDVPAGVQTKAQLGEWWESQLARYPSGARERFWREFQSLVPYRESKKFNAAELATRQARQLEMGRHILDELDRITRTRPID